MARYTLPPPVDDSDNFEMAMAPYMSSPGDSTRAPAAAAGDVPAAGSDHERQGYPENPAVINEPRADGPPAPNANALIGILDGKLQQAWAFTKSRVQDSWKGFREVREDWLEWRDALVDWRIGRSSWPSLRREWEHLKRPDKMLLSMRCFRRRHKAAVADWIKVREQSVLRDFARLRRAILGGNKIMESEAKEWTLGDAAKIPHACHALPRRYIERLYDD
ncbi:hypothetical protein B0T24DRAFT_718008 [Lasiosphaeria ovina]|uniref:Uncharacterized protein n=1 Tax=Lasiosphaeria ovina TaxID=92902 RepID=A0AAE0TUV8_9PEZI|nr:hypothetical protein B0T24DRAFT_718008 [Lasiosphaeria ovina]